MGRLLRTVRTWVQRLGVAVLLGQLVSVVTLVSIENFRKKRRKVRRFPYTPAVPMDVGEDELTIYSYGEDLFAHMLEAIDGASEVIHFETYIWKADEVGQRFKDALIRAAARGVQVNVVWDEFANLVVPRRFLRMPGSLNVMRHPAIPVPWSPKSWGRDHRKLLVVDRKVGFIGGYNIGSLYATGWRDTHARIVGPGVSELENAFIDFWNLHVKRRRLKKLPDDLRRSWISKIRVHRNMPKLRVFPIRNMYLEAIDRATERIWLTHAYLIPDDDLVNALRDAVQRGADVRIIVPAQSNHVVADWLSRGYYDDLLRSGIRLFLYRGAMVHSKTATIDGTWATIGTANLDRLSLRGNYEVNLEILDENISRQMEEIFEVDLRNTYELSLEEWRTRSWVAKGTELLLSPWRPIF
ncbi:phospholipase D-like domain-containing protein [Tessaracoccus antarcticus]|uniref:phospholipase D-like domain-containing protein n=1 Tax=Tessaracoccus antarcticus TaxID=2479848 RepID=UPI001F39C001|nr:phospholipase D-like domain-containing protein [Tessaracoccus antarcticus]